MAKYEKIFSPTLYKGLKALSGLSGKEAMKRAVNSAAILKALGAIEAPHKQELQTLAVELCREMFPIIDYAGYKIDARLTSMEDVNRSLDEANDKPGEHEVSDQEMRRVVNGITQGAAVRATSAYTYYDLYTDYINNIDETLLEKYKDLMRTVFGSYDSDANVATFLQMVQMGNKMGGGSSKVTVNRGVQEANSKPTVTITALAICFPMLVHEITKGLYEAISLHGFKGTKEENQAIVDAVDTLENEIDDLRFGKFIYDAIVDVYADSQYDDPRVRENLFLDIYKLPKADFGEFIRTAVATSLIKKYKSLPDQEKRTLQAVHDELMTAQSQLERKWKKWTDWCNGAMAQADRRYKAYDAKKYGGISES